MRLQRSSARQTLWTGFIENQHLNATHFDAQTLSSFPPQHSSLYSQFFPVKSWSTRIVSSFVIGASERRCASSLHIFLTRLQRRVTGHWTSSVYQRNGETKNTQRRGPPCIQTSGEAHTLWLLVVLTYIPLVQTSHG